MPPPGPRPVRPAASRGQRHGSLRRTLLGATLATTFPFLALIGYLAWNQVSRERGRVERDALAHATLLSGQLTRHLSARLEAVRGTVTVLGETGVHPGSAEAQVRRLRQTFPDVEGALVVDELGVAVAASPAPEGGRRIAVGDQAWFKRVATSTEPLVGEPSGSGADTRVPLYGPIRTPEGQLRGVVVVELAGRRIRDLLAAPGLPEGTVAAALTPAGRVLARQPLLAGAANVAELPAYARLVQRGSGSGEVVFEDGAARLAGAARVPAADWVVVVGLPSAELLRDTRRQLLQVGGAAAVLAVLALAAALHIARRQVEGFGRLRQAMARLETGDLPASLPVTVGGEAGALTERFNSTLSWLRGKLREYEVMSDVEAVASEVVTGDRSVDAVLPGLLRRVVSGVQADVGVMLLHDDGALEVRAAVGFPADQTTGVRLRRGQGLVGAVAGERVAVVVPDVEADYRVEEPFLKQGGVRSAAALPMFAGEDLLGVVLVGHRTAHVFPPDEVQRLEAIVRRTAQAIERARAIDSVQRNTQGLEAQLAAQGAALQQATAEQAEARRQAQEARKRAQELEQRMRQQAAQPPQVKEVIVEREVVRPDASAAEVARLRAEMQRTVTEELRAPLTALLELPRLLVEGLQKPLDEAERGQLEVLQEHGQDILELIEGLTVLSGLRAGRLKVVRAPVDVGMLVQRVVRVLQPRAAAKGNRIDVDVKPGLGPVPTDSRRLEQALTNVLLSAIKYTEVGEIRVTVHQRDRDVVLTVADDGIGFTPEEQARIFEPFLAIAPRGGRSLPGTGLLLAVAERLVDALGGKIRVESEPDRGTWVTMTLPVQ